MPVLDANSSIRGEQHRQQARRGHTSLGSAGKAACICAGAAVLVLLERVLCLSSCTGVASCGLDGGGCQRLCNADVCSVGMAGEQRQ